MRFSIQREALLNPLQQVVGVVERRQTLPVLANLLVQVEQGRLTLTGTDLEVEMRASIAVENGEEGATTIPARKLFDIVRALADGSQDRKSTRLNSSHPSISYAVICWKEKT